MPPLLDEAAFRRELTTGLDGMQDRLGREQLSIAVAHARLLLQWNPVVGLTRLVEAGDLAKRHFLESLLVAGLVPPGDGAGPGLRVLDIGSGGGFPGLAMRLARPDLVVTLLEPRGRKAAFLRAAARLYPPPPTRVIARRLEDVHDEAPWPVVTMRAVRIPVGQLLRVTAAGATVITLAGEQASGTSNELAEAGFVLRRSVPIPGRVGEVLAWRRSG